jgi:hypothetical protein
MPFVLQKDKNTPKIYINGGCESTVVDHQFFFLDFFLKKSNVFMYFSTFL